MDGEKHIIDGGVTIADDITTEAVIASDAQKQMSISYRRSPTTARESNDALDVRQSKLMLAYFTDGSINGAPTEFQIDTGASSVAISTELAERAGIQCGAAMQSYTANGIANGCRGVASELVFGMFRLANVEVIILPNLPSGSLLGMNVLKQFNMIWMGDTVRISSNEPVDKGLSPYTHASAPMANLVKWRGGGK